MKPYLPWDVIPTPLYNSTRNIVEGQGAQLLAPAPTPAPVAEAKDPSSCEVAPSDRLPRVPEWIRDTAPLKPVFFTKEAVAGLQVLGDNHGFKYCADVAHAKAFVVQVLCQDIRGAYQGRGGASVDIPIDLLFPGVTTEALAADPTALPPPELPLPVTYREVVQYIAKHNLNGKHVIYVCNLDRMYIEFVTTHNIILVLRVVDNGGQIGGYVQVDDGGVVNPGTV